MSEYKQVMCPLCKNQLILDDEEVKTGNVSCAECSGHFKILIHKKDGSNYLLVKNKILAIFGNENLFDWIFEIFYLLILAALIPGIIEIIIEIINEIGKYVYKFSDLSLGIRMPIYILIAICLKIWLAKKGRLLFG